MSQKTLNDQERSERHVHMNNAVFDVRNIALLKESFNALYPLWQEVATARENREVYDSAGFERKLLVVTKEHWDSLSSIFLKDPYHGYGMGNFTSDDQIPAKLIMDLVEITSKMNSDINHELKLQSGGTTQLRNEIKKLQAELTDTKKDLIDARWKTHNASMQLTSLRENLEHLEARNTEKSDMIAQLQRDGTVQLWEREKQKFLEKSGLRVKELEKELETVKADRGKMHEKLMTLEGNLKLEKMRGEVLKRPNGKQRTELEDENENLKRSKFLMEKDIQKLDMELYNFQKATVGILQGLKKDYEKIIRPILDGSKGSFTEDDCFRARLMLQVLRKTTEASKHGKLVASLADIPDDYIGIDSDVVETVVKRIVGRTRGKLTPIGEKSKRAGGTDAKQTKDSKNDKTGRRESVPGDHPTLIDPNTGRVDMIRVMRSFHHMTEAFVKDHWEQFKKYDTNGDGTLDLGEMMHAMMSTVGSQFTAVQIQEAMLEVDIDGSDDVDFYEYLCVANMMQNKRGKAQVFKSKLVQQEGRIVSKTCVVM